MEGAGLDGRDLVGGGCSDKVALTSWTGQATNIGRASLEDGEGYQVLCLNADPGDSWKLAGERVAARRSGGKRRGEGSS